MHFLHFSGILHLPNLSSTHNESHCAMTQRGAAGLKAPATAVARFLHLENYMSLHSLLHKSPLNNLVSVTQHVSVRHMVSVGAQK